MVATKYEIQSCTLSTTSLCGSWPRRRSSESLRLELLALLWPFAVARPRCLPYLSPPVAGYRVSRQRTDHRIGITEPSTRRRGSARPTEGRCTANIPYRIWFVGLCGNCSSHMRRSINDPLKICFSLTNAIVHLKVYIAKRSKRLRYTRYASSEYGLYSEARA